MKRLWAPWRLEFIKSARLGKNKCIFCEKPEEKKDDENYILFRGRKNFVILNIFPYNNGHLMVSPYRHLSSMDEMTDEELLENFMLVAKFSSLIKKEFNADGFNIGINLGKTAGAGFEHVHTHVVPRWNGDSNYMPVIAGVKVMPELLSSTYEKLKNALKQA